MLEEQSSTCEEYDAVERESFQRHHTWIHLSVIVLLIGSAGFTLILDEAVDKEQIQRKFCFVIGVSLSALCIYGLEKMLQKRFFLPTINQLVLLYFIILVLPNMLAFYLLEHNETKTHIKQHYKNCQTIEHYIGNDANWKQVKRCRN